MLSILVNGEPREVPEGTTAADLVTASELAPDQVAVEINRALVARATRAERALETGDRVELVTLVGGG